jgi:uncharacterized protein (TIGR02466 family)
MDQETTTPDIPVSFAHNSANEIFPTLLWIADLAPQTYEPLNRLISAKLDAILGTRKQSYMSETFQTPQDLHHLAEFRPLCIAVEKLAQGALRQLAIDYTEIAITALWANVNPPGAKHSIHSHPNNYFSGVYYVQADAKANVIRFHDPRGAAEAIMPPRAQQNVYNANSIEMEAKPGRLVLFPAWLKHDVPTNLSSRERISLAYNLMFPNFTEKMAAPLWKGGAKKGVR